VARNIIPDQDDRAAELLVRGIQEPGVLVLSEPLALICAARAVRAEDQPRTAPGPDRDQRGQ
jgi:hypothetical protein